MFYIPLSEALSIPVRKLSLMLMILGGGSHGIRLHGEMFQGGASSLKAQ